MGGENLFAVLPSCARAFYFAVLDVLGLARQLVAVNERSLVAAVVEDRERRVISPASGNDSAVFPLAVSTLRPRKGQFLTVRGFKTR